MSSPPRHPQLTSKNKKECWLEAASQSSSAILYFSPARWRCGSPSPASLRTPFLSARLPTHAYMHAPHTHPPPPPRPPCTHPLHVPPHARAARTRYGSPNTSLKTLPHARMSPRVPPRTGAFHSCTSDPRLHRQRLGSLSPLSFPGWARGDWRPDPPRSSASWAARSLPGALSSPRLSTWPASRTGPLPLLTSQESPGGGGGGTSQAPPPEPSDSGESGLSVEGNPPQFPVLRNGVGGRGYWVRQEALPFPTEKNAHLVPKASLPFSFQPEGRESQGLWV